MAAYVVPIVTTQVFVLPVTAAYDAVMAWLNAASVAVRLQHGIVTVAGQRSQRRITITAVSVNTDIDTDIPLMTLPL